MYLHRLELVNTGPINNASIDFRFNEHGSPQPVVFVGQNGAGKSFSIAHIVSALIAAHGTVFDDSDVEKGKVYKLRSPSYIRSGAEYSIAKINFSDGFLVSEAQLLKKKIDLEEPPFNYERWGEIPDNETSHYYSNFYDRHEKLKGLLDSSTHLFFPPNRFEEPAWLNEKSLINKASYPTLRKFSHISNRPIINHAPMIDLQSWLLDLIYDSNAIEKHSFVYLTIGENGQPTSAHTTNQRSGPATEILNPIEDFLKVLFGKPGQLAWFVGARNNRQIGVQIDGEFVTTNLFQLSTGQSALLDLFLTIIRDFDLGSAHLSRLSDIDGIVVVDEIDLHLHANLQHDLLPKLIQIFPKVQFIITTHSPLFVMGMEKIFTADGFQLIELPSGSEIEAERFSEFEAAYKHMQESALFQAEIKQRIEAAQKPIIFLEGATDISYLIKAAEVLEKEGLIRGVELVDSGGCSYIDKIWGTYNTHLANTIKQKWLLLYDCDARKPACDNGNLSRRTIPQQPSKIDSGIENIFPNSTIEKAMRFKSEFIDITSEHTAIKRGESVKIAETWKVNRDEKRNLCDWICKNGDAEDFINFSVIFHIIEEIFSSTPVKGTKS